MMSAVYQTRKWISITTGLIALCLVYCFAPVYATQPRGVILPAQHIRPISNANNIITYANKPKGFQPLGMVRVELHDDGHQHDVVTELTNYADVLSAKVGANALLMKAVYHTKSTGVDNVLASYQLYAEAGWVKP